MNDPPLMPAVFLDRDGTLIEDRGHLHNPEEVVFFPRTVSALRILQGRFKLFIVTNQSGIAEGVLQPAEVQRVNEFVVSHLSGYGIRIEQVYCCPHRRPDGCSCIKPKPYFLELAAQTHGIDLQKSFSIGDHPHDVEFGEAGGGTGIYVLTGHGLKHRADLPEEAIVAGDIWIAANIALLKKAMSEINIVKREG